MCTIDSVSFEMGTDVEEGHVAYTDGACKNNQDQSKSKATYGGFFMKGPLSLPLETVKEISDISEFKYNPTPPNSLFTGAIW